MLKVFCSQVILVVLVGKDILIEAILFYARELQMILFFYLLSEVGGMQWQVFVGLLLQLLDKSFSNFRRILQKIALKTCRIEDKILNLQRKEEKLCTKKEVKKNSLQHSSMQLEQRKQLQTCFLA